MPQTLAAGCLLLLCVAGACSDNEDSQSASGPLTEQELLQACIRTAACGIKPQPRLSNCVDYYQTLVANLGQRPVYDGIFRCVNRAGGDCTEIFDCFGSHPAAGRCDRTYQARCNDGVASTCDLLDQRVYRYDCAKASLGCQVKQGEYAFEAVCTLGQCTLGDYPRHCDQDRVLACYQGVIVADDCAGRGLICMEDPKLTAVCVGAEGITCDEQTYERRCEGNDLLFCVYTSVSRYNCSNNALAKRCENGACVPSHGECVDQFNRCDGDALQACVDGKWQSFDCEGLGLLPCVTQSYGASCGAVGGSA